MRYAYKARWMSKKQIESLRRNGALRESIVVNSFKGFILAINLEDAARVNAAYETMKTFKDIRVMGEPKDLSFGGRGFEFVDPEGNAWEVVWAEDTSFDERGGLIFP